MWGILRFYTVNKWMDGQTRRDSLDDYFGILELVNN